MTRKRKEEGYGTPDEPRFPVQDFDRPVNEQTPLEKELDSRTEEDEALAEERERLRDATEALRHRLDPEYKAKSRAKFLRSVDITTAYSPGSRLTINRPKGDPNVYRFNHDEVRRKIGTEGWVPVTDMEHAQRICPSAYIEKRADGRIYSGDSYLCMQSEESVEMRNAQVFAKSERAMRAAEKGKLAPGGESFQEMHDRTRTSDDPTGIHFKGTLSEDKVSQSE
jgi:hypothetical protein